MANPFHDESGRFCSRDQMLNCIHQLATNGNVAEYIKLKSEFDEIDKGNTVVSKELLSTLLTKAGVSDNVDISHPEEVINELNKQETEEKPNLYSTFSGNVLAEMIEDMGYQTVDGTHDYKEEILKALKESNYNEEALYSAVSNRGLTYEQKAKLATEHDPTLYSVLIEKYPEEVMTNDKSNLISAIKDLSAKPDLNQDEKYQLGEMVKGLAKEAKNKEDLQVAVDNVIHGDELSQATTAIVANKNITKQQALAVLDGETRMSTGNYWSARGALTRNLSSKGFLMIPLGDFNHNPTRLTGSAPADKLSKLEEIEKVEATRKYSIVERFSRENTVKDAYAEVDIYADNFKDLKKKLSEAEKDSRKNTSKVNHDGLMKVVELRQRVENAITYLNQKEDYFKVRQHISALKF
jgi:hypothetical protein